jgi:hypothetical protein
VDGETENGRLQSGSWGTCCIIIRESLSLQIPPYNQEGIDNQLNSPLASFRDFNSTFPMLSIKSYM